jgi:hypothetical protein
MKMTKITGTETVDGKIQLISIENVASRDELLNEFGEEETRVYLDGSPNYIRAGSVLLRSGGEYRSVWSGFYTKEDFNQIVSQMKEAGERLKEIREKVAKQTTFTVLI